MNWKNKGEKVMALGSDQSDIVSRTAAVTVVFLGLYASSLYNYILFHSLIEFTTIAIAFTLFTLTWNARRFLISGCLKALGIGYGLIALVDLLHSLAYKGMGVFPGYDANLPTQLWIAARSLQALLLCLAPLFARRKLDERVFFGLSLAAVSASAALVYSGGFPDCFIEGTGLTPFKIVSEYVISSFLLVALCLFIGNRAAFNTRVFRLIAVSILCTIGSELAFTSYLSVFGPANMTGHFLKLAAFYLIYRALVVTGFQEPLDLIFRELKLAEHALTREREFSSCLLESMADGVVACDADGILTLFNRSAREWHGMNPLRLPPEEWARHYDLFRADGITPLPTDEIPLASAFRGEIVRDAGMAIKAKGQPIRFIVANGSVIQDEAGQKLGAVVIMRDVTEFGRLELELRKANEELEKRVEKRTDELRKTAMDLNEAQRIAHVGSWELNLLTNQLSWSDEIYRIFEIDPRAFGASYEAFMQAVHPDDREAVNAAYTNSVRIRTPYSIDHRLLLPGGRIKYVNEHCETIYENNKPIRSLGTVHDVTEQKLVEERLRKFSEELEQRVKERTAELILGQTRLKQAYDRLTESNEELEMEVEERTQVEEELRAARDELEERVAERTAALHSLNEQLQSELRERIHADEENRKLKAELEERVAARTGDLEEKGSELLQSQKALMNIVDDLNEKTMELEEANTKLRDLDRLKSMFIASMSHELRTPLNSIIGFSSILHDEWLGPVNSEQKENLSTILRSGKHLLSLINDVIDVSKVEAGKIDSLTEEFDLYDLLVEAVNYLEKDIREKSLELHQHPHHLKLRTDRRRLLQCLVNLLSNAVKFTEKGSISITSIPGKEETDEGGGIAPGFVSISVSDTGIGISDEDIPSLFHPFMRLESPLKTIVPGTGLGLYLTRKLVTEILKGDILCTSRIGEGSTFTICIPESLNGKGTGYRGQQG